MHTRKWVNKCIVCVKRKGSQVHTMQSERI